MIGSLTGRVAEVGRHELLLEAGGIGWRVLVSAPTLARLAPGVQTRLLTELVVGQDQPQMFGFPDIGERDAFRLLTGVQGVGGRLALAILSTLAPAELAAAVALDDRAALARSPGVGPRLAARLVTELKPHMGGLGGGTTAGAGPGVMPHADGPLGEARAALAALGLRPTEADQALAQARSEAGADAPVGQLVRLALRRVAR